ncbi:MAG TPA: S-adenosyl-l-methionine hydroxide adenosyltransferase family protein [Pseudogracilibacillus sp.]|nr:S-adenosyl-l-methionine hydroxide adenosyltransferase family protein [Pseudogracilibacillus sp.]
MLKKIVFQTDFGLSDGAVSAMYGVSLKVDSELDIYDLTHEIPQYNIWEASYRLYQTITYWPEETVFVSVVDPGVGTERQSVVVKTKENQYIITPNNGTLTHIEQEIGILSIREIDEAVNRLPESGASYTFHGRDIYAYTGARLASGVIEYEEVGPELDLQSVITLNNPKAYLESDVLYGKIDILDVRFGNIWTNISRELFLSLDVDFGDLFEVTIIKNDRQIFKNTITYGRSFADSRLGEAILFVNSVDSIGIAINQGSFAQAYHVETGINWKIEIKKVDK